jgi:enoyl-CoA hydratase
MVRMTVAEAAEGEFDGAEVENFDEQGHVLVRRAGMRAEVRLNRPEKLNALDVHTVIGIKNAFDALGEDDAVKVIIFRGEGRAFSTGGDVGTLGVQYGSGTTQRYRLRFEETKPRGAFEAILYSPKIVIGEGKNYVLGVAVDLFSACDITICSEGTVFGYPPARMIAATGVNSVFWMLRLGLALYSEMCMMGRFFGAEEALKHGLVNRVVPLDELEATVSAAADAVCAMPADGLYISKFNKKVALDTLGVAANALQSAMGHAMQVNQRVGPDEWNLVKARANEGVRGAIASRDAPFREANLRYDADGPAI